MIDRKQPIRTLFVLFTTIASIQCALSARGDHHLAGSAIRRLRRFSPRSAAGPTFSNLKPEKSCLLFIGIPSASQERRNAIRETWGRLLQNSHSSEVVVRFYVHEQCSTRIPCQGTEAQFGDIIYTRDGDDDLGTLADGQEGVTQRVYLMFQHVVSNFDAKFIMKADDDTFINAPALLQMLHKLSKDTSNFFYVGMRLSRDWSLEEEKELAALAKEDVGEDDGYLSTYMQGGAYILSKEAVEGIVALNHATGLRFLHYEDVAVGVWVSGMRLKFITDWDIGYHFVGQANLWGPDQLDVLKVTDNYCQDADMPLAWVHPLKETAAFLEVARISGACNWTVSWDRDSGLEPI